MLAQKKGNPGTPWFSLQVWPELFEGPNAQLWSLSCLVGCLWEEEFSASLYSILRGDHTMAHSPGIRIDLKIIPTLHSEEGQRRHDLRWCLQGRITGAYRDRDPRATLPILAPADLPGIPPPWLLRPALTCCIMWNKCLALFGP